MDNRRVLVPTKGPGLRDNKSEKEDKNARFCNRIGCNGRLNHAKGVQTGCSGKTKPLSPSGSSSRKEIVKIPSTTGADIADRKSAPSQRRSNSNKKLEIGGLSDVAENHGISDTPSKAHRMIRTGTKEIVSGKTKLSGVGSSSISSNIRPWRKSSAISGNGKQSISPLPSVPSSSKATSSTASCGLINLNCSRISDVLPNGPPTESMVNRRGEIRQRDPDGESSSSGRGKKLTGNSSYEGSSLQPKNGNSASDVRSSRRWNSGISIGPSSVTNGRSRQMNDRVAHSDQGKKNNAPLGNSTSTISGSRRRLTPHNSDVNAPYRRSPARSSTHSSSPSTSVGSDVLGSIQSNSTEVGVPRFRNRGAYWHYDIDGIAEVLMELERIEQNDDVTFERLLALETNLFLSGLNAFDQHRDMRLDIDNMSYEELLALEERMGSVSTALSEEAITKCLQRSTYQPNSSDEADLGSGHQNDIKCSICQEEYLVGDEIGNLGCEHSYHIQCIEQWLRVKNWCPICKGSASGTKSLS